jgi:hypothetical protein
LDVIAILQYTNHFYPQALVLCVLGMDRKSDIFDWWSGGV